MIALFDDVPVLHKEDIVGIANGRKAMRDDKARSAAHELAHSFADLRLRSSIDRRGRLVQDQDGRIAQKYPRDREELALPHR